MRMVVVYFACALSLVTSVLAGCSDNDSVRPEPVDDCIVNPFAAGCMPPCVTGTSSCANCSCLSDEQCREGLGCVGFGEVDDPCVGDSDCESGNCSETSRVCRVSVGEPCTEFNCDRCLTHTSGWSYCSRLCLSERDCGGGLCLTPFLSRSRCQPDCDVNCPTECGNISSGGQFCQCSSDLGCVVRISRGDVGAICIDDSQCETSDCYDGGLNGTRYGYCSINCFGPGECPTGYRCVGTFCDENGVTGCDAHKCMPVCDDTDDCPTPPGLTSTAGECRRRRPIEGPDITVCDPRSYPNAQ